MTSNTFESTLRNNMGKKLFRYDDGSRTQGGVGMTRRGFRKGGAGRYQRTTDPPLFQSIHIHPAVIIGLNIVIYRYYSVLVMPFINNVPIVQ